MLNRAMASADVSMAVAQRAPSISGRDSAIIADERNSHIWFITDETRHSRAIRGVRIGTDHGWVNVVVCLQALRAIPARIGGAATPKIFRMPWFRAIGPYMPEQMARKALDGGAAGHNYRC